MTLGALILGLSFLQASYPPRRRDSSSTSSIKDSKSGSCWLERKRCFLLATPVAKSGSRRLEHKRCFSLATPVTKSGSCWLERKRRFSLATPAQSYKSQSKIAVATVCQPILEEHDSRRLERKHCFLLATPVAKFQESFKDCG